MDLAEPLVQSECPHHKLVIPGLAEREPRKSGATGVPLAPGFRIAPSAFALRASGVGAARPE